MAGGPIRIWNEWATQILVLLSFTLQIFLFLFARTRRHGPCTMLKILLWLVYLMADSTAVYTLGHLSMRISPREEKLAVFWAPFLLVHLGSQDTITAYALEDNKLWPRHLLNLGVQAFGVAYVLYRHIAEIPTLLGSATVLMFIVGFIKYGERIWALKCANLNNILSSIREPQALPTYYSGLPRRGPREEVRDYMGLRRSEPFAEVRDEEELLLFAHGLLPLCKGAMADLPVALFSRYGIMNWNWEWNWKATVKVVEMELSLMYDILYTMAAVIHNWYGYCIHVFSLLATVVAFILFQLSGNKDRYSRVDVGITYILLVDAFLLDMVSVLSALGSTWTCHLLWTRGWSHLGLVILSLRRHVNAARGNRRWSGSIGQFDLLHFCRRDKTKLSSRVAKMIGLKDWWNKWRYAETLVISEDVKDLVFQRVWQVLKEIHVPGGWHDGALAMRFRYESQSTPMAMMPTEITGFAPESYKDTARRRLKLAEALGFGSELQEAILTWHLFTDVFLLRSAYWKGVKALSNYMVFLIAVRPDTIPGLELRSLYEATRDSLDQVWGTSGQREGVGGGIDRKRNVILRRGEEYANLLLDLVDTQNPNKPDIIPFYEDIDRAGMEKLKRRLMPDLESSCPGGVLDMTKALVLILDAWVRLLIFASIRCSRDAHAGQINCGGELTTVVWLMEEHASMFFKPPEEEKYTRLPEDSESEEIELGDRPRMVLDESRSSEDSESEEIPLGEQFRMAWFTRKEIVKHGNRVLLGAV